MKFWTLRPYDPMTDENVCVSMWLRSYLDMSCEAHVVTGGHFERKNNPEAYRAKRRALWSDYSPLVAILLTDQKTTLAVDEKHPDTVLGFICEAPDPAASGKRVVHFMALKNDLDKLGVTKEVAADLAGDKLGAADVGMSFEAVDVRKHEKRTHFEWGKQWKTETDWIRRYAARLAGVVREA